MINVTKLIRNAIIANNITDEVNVFNYTIDDHFHCLLYTSPSPRDR
ncbi:hypothetical protein MU476_15595, partial [Staphylococcus aureus]|nr:hypothetical protein [Staphylococcus aureus]